MRPDRPHRAVPILLVLLLLLAACGGEDAATTTTDDTAADGDDGADEAPDGDPIRIGMAADFSDVYSFYDIPVRDGAEFAIEEINAAGGIDGRPLELTSRDGRNDQPETLRATQELLDGGAAALLGTTGDPFVAQAQLACAADTAITTGDGTAPTLVGDAGDCAYQLVLSDTLSGAVAAEFALEEGYETAYLLGSSEVPYTANLPRYFATVFEDGGGEIVGEGEFRIDSGDFGAQVTEIAALSPAPDVIFTPMFVPDTPVFMRQLRSAGVDIPVVSTDGSHDTSLLDAGEAVEGLVLTTHGLPEEGNVLDELFARYAESSGSEPESVVFGVGYDQMTGLAQAIEAAGSAEPADVLAAMGDISVDGATGEMVIDPDTRRATKAISIVEVVDGAFNLVDQRVPETILEP